MWENIKPIFNFFIPNKIDDTSQKTTDLKLATGIGAGFFLIFKAFGILDNVEKIIIEEFAGLKISNATIVLLSGVFFIWLTLTKVGIKTDDKEK